MHEKSLPSQKPQKPKIYELQLTSNSFLTCMLWKGWTSNQRRNSQLRFSAILFVKATKQKGTSAISFANYKETPFLNIIDWFHVYVQFSVHNKALQIHLKN
jgi:hypothetical protein